MTVRAERHGIHRPSRRSRNDFRLRRNELEHIEKSSSALKGIAGSQRLNCKSVAGDKVALLKLVVGLSSELPRESDSGFSSGIGFPLNGALLVAPGQFFVLSSHLFVAFRQFCVRPRQLFVLSCLSFVPPRKVALFDRHQGGNSRSYRERGESSHHAASKYHRLSMLAHIFADELIFGNSAQDRREVSDGLSKGRIVQGQVFIVLCKTQVDP
jgi:hypothetical protein